MALEQPLERIELVDAPFAGSRRVGLNDRELDQSLHVTPVSPGRSLPHLRRQYVAVGSWGVLPRPGPFGTVRATHHRIRLKQAPKARRFVLSDSLGLCYAVGSGSCPAEWCSRSCITDPFRTKLVAAVALPYGQLDRLHHVVGHDPAVLVDVDKALFPLGGAAACDRDRIQGDRLAGRLGSPLPILGRARLVLACGSMPSQIGRRPCCRSCPMTLCNRSSSPSGRAAVSTHSV
jgi:hypothetical protein